MAGGGHKRQSSSVSEDVEFRILCHSSKIPSVIGKSGCIIKILKLATGAKINVEDTVLGLDQRIVSIRSSGSLKATKRLKNGEEVSMDIKSPGSAAQQALFKLQERIVHGENNLVEGDTVTMGVTTRLLVSSNQVGPQTNELLEQAKRMSGAQVSIVSKEQRAAFALPNDDEIVQIVGEFHAVKNALEIVSSGLQSSRQRSVEASESRSFHAPAVPAFHAHEWSHTRRRAVESEEVSYRILCPYDKIGRVTGKSGNARVLCESNGSRIKIPDQITGSEDRIIIVSAPENYEEISPAQLTLLRIQERIDCGDFDGVCTARLLITSKQVGSVLGKGGNIISEIRKSTGANIKILYKDELPLCASDSDELVQVTGQMQVVKDALLQITSRLRNLPRKWPLLISPGIKEGLRVQQQDTSPTTPSLISPTEVKASPSRLAPPQSVEVMIPSAALNQVLGKNGSHLGIIRQVRTDSSCLPALRSFLQISGAKLSLLDSKPAAASERLVSITGTPEQNFKAQRLLEAFVISAESL